MQHVTQPIKQIDHFTPVSGEGVNKKWNKVVCCFMCNSIKSRLTPAEFIAELHRLKEEGFKKLKFNNFYNQEKLDFMISQVQKVIHDHHSGMYNMSGYYTIKKEKDGKEPI